MAKNLNQEPSGNQESLAQRLLQEEEKVQQLEERIEILESRFQLLEELVPKELRNLSHRVTALGQWVGFDKGEKE